MEKVHQRELRCPSPTTPLPSSSHGYTATSSSSHGASEEKSKVVIEEVKPAVPAALVSDLSGLVEVFAEPEGSSLEVHRVQGQWCFSWR